jgi:hypothetical protein
MMKKQPLLQSIFKKTIQATTKNGRTVSEKTLVSILTCTLTIKTIKYYYLEAKKIKRLDKGIFSIISYIRNKIIERIIKNTKGLSSNHIIEIDKRHHASLISSFVIEVYSDLWKVATNL